MPRCWATAAMPAVRQPPSATSTYSTGVIPLSCAANCSGWSMSKPKLRECRCSSPKPWKVSTSARLCVPLTQDTVERHWNRAISGASANASRAPSRASTFTPLSMTDVVMLVSSISSESVVVPPEMTPRAGTGRTSRQNVRGARVGCVLSALPSSEQVGAPRGHGSGGAMDTTEITDRGGVDCARYRPGMCPPSSAMSGRSPRRFGRPPGKPAVIGGGRHGRMTA